MRGLSRVNNLTRRSLLKGVTTVPALFHVAKAAKPTDIRVQEMRLSYEDFTYRTPIKFGGTVLDRATILNVNCVVRTVAGRTAKGFGSMPLSNVWAFPSHTMPYEVTLGAMKALAERISAIIGGCKESGHPIDLNVLLEPEFLKAADEVSRRLKLAEPIPKLCMLVTASAFDAAVHDAFGKVHGLNCYRTYGPDFMSYDLSHYLTPEFKGEYVSQYVARDPKPRMPLYHLVGAVDPIFDSDVTKRVGDGLPETLPQWIRYNGLTHLKIKLNGDNQEWDVDRVLSVDRAATETEPRRKWFYSLDFNEKCPNVAYLIDFLRRVKEKSSSGFERIQYVEQPTARDLKSHRENVMTAASKLCPVVIDESLTDFENLMLAREMGYTGAALKACKTQSQAMLMAAAGQKYKMFLCVQDLTCPGASLIHSAGLAAHVPTVAAIEANSRQYVPAANKAWESRFPGIFHITDGDMDTSHLTGHGLGAVAD
jgi:L-alanine-DL-glutamate epimerase-like enolase superfamily enzyme